MENFEFNEILREMMYTNELSSGAKCYIIPKKEYAEKQASVVFNYGSADTRFQRDGDIIETPCGIAHFLEHKLFENKSINVFNRFTQQGASVNAYTNYTTTAYYFNCIEQFDLNFELLLNFSQQPYFTDDNVEKEKGIIEQEINMYLDNPHWQLFINLQKAMYHQSPIRIDIAGSVESIQGITKELLYECFETFYFPGNSAIICAGDIEPQYIYEIADKLIKPAPTKKINRLYGNEPQNVKESYTEAKMAVSMPLFNLGFKEDRFDESLADRIAATRLLTDIIAGQSSDVFERMYNEGLVDNTFSAEYVLGAFFGASIFSGNSKDPKKVCSYILDEANRLKNDGINDDRFQMIKKKHIGSLIRSFNSIDSIVSSQADMFTKNINIFELMQSYNNINLECIQNRLQEHFRDDNHSLSVVYPIE